MNTPQEAAHWSVARLMKLGVKRLHKLSVRVAGQLTCCRLLLGRCLLVMHRTDGVSHFGCSSALQYAGTLGLSAKLAGECIRVARCLESLPVLRAAAEAGTIGWSALREVTHKATPDTEARWLELAQSYIYKIIEELVSKTDEGENPPDPDLAAHCEPVESTLRLRMPALVMNLFQRAVRELSHQAGRPVTVVEAIELLCVEYLGGSVEQWRAESEKDLAARRPPRQEPSWGPAGATLLDLPDDAPRDFPARGGDDPPAEALAVRRYVDPTIPVDIAVPDRDTGWSNPRLRYSGNSRAPTPAQKAELLRRDGYCCANPGCRNRLWLDVHHVVFYFLGGVTLPENLIVVCTRCHRNLHRGWLKVSGTAPHGLVWTDRTGALMHRARALEG